MSKDTSGPAFPPSSFLSKQAMDVLEHVRDDKRKEVAETIGAALSGLTKREWTNVAFDASDAKKDQSIRSQNIAFIRTLAELAASWGASQARQTTAELPEATVWTLTEELTSRQTTTNGHLWFSNPVNCSWSPLYTATQMHDHYQAGVRVGMAVVKESLTTQAAMQGDQQ